MTVERHLLRHADGRRLYVFGELRGDLADTIPWTRRATTWSVCTNATTR